jgi:hypothetical protein
MVLLCNSSIWSAPTSEVDRSRASPGKRGEVHPSPTENENSEVASGGPSRRLASSRIALTLRWLRLSEQIFRVDKWSLCRG